MKPDDLLDAFGEADEKTVAAADERMQETKPKRRPLPYLGAAACICLLLASLAVLLPQLRFHPVEVDVPDIPTDAPVVGEGFTDYGENLPGGGDGSMGAPPAFEFRPGIVVEAKMSDPFSSDYRMIGGGRYRLLHLEVLDVVRGENVPGQIWYLLPYSLGTDFTDYSSFILTLRQVGMEKTLLVEEDTRRACTFDFVFVSEGPTSDPSYGAVIPFRDGAVDPSLGEERYWGVFGHYMNDDAASLYGYPAEKGDKVEAVKTKIRRLIEDEYYRPYSRVLSRADLGHEELLASLLDSPKNTYIQSVDNGSVLFTRVICGFKTNERVCFDREGTVSYDGEAFTEEEASSLYYTLGAAISAIDVDSLTPPHLKDFASMQYPRCTVGGRYVKRGGVVYSVIRVGWSAQKDEQIWLDDLYLLASDDGKVKEISRSALSELIPLDPILSTFPYGKGQDILYA